MRKMLTNVLHVCVAPVLAHSFLRDAVFYARFHLFVLGVRRGQFQMGCRNGGFWIRWRAEQSLLRTAHG